MPYELRVLRLLHELGLDLSATCDAEEFGSAIFYAVYLGRVECLQVCVFELCVRALSSHKNPFQSLLSVCSTLCCP